jgi:hypothetical protein
MWDDFDSKLQEFKLKMTSPILNVFGPFLTFLEFFI